MDPERPIEKLLRDYAAQRREKAGAPLEVHPATRNLLQGEVTRTYRASDAAEPVPSQGIARLWRLWIFGLATACVLALGVVVWVSSSGHRNTALELARNENLEPARDKDQLARAKSAPAPATPVAPPAAELAQVEAAKQLDAPVASAAPPVVAEADKAAAAQRPAESEKEIPARSLAQTDEKTRDLFMRRYGLMPGPATPSGTGVGGTVTAPATPPSPTLADNQPAAAPPAVRSLQSSAASRLAVASGREVSPLPVLNSFQVETTDGQVRITDADGSVYSGSAQPLALNQANPGYSDAANSAARFSAPQDGFRGRDLAVGGAGPQPSLKRAESQFAPSGTTGAAMQPAQQLPSFRFRVAGTNRTLGRLVVFAGQMFGPTNSVSWVRTNLNAPLLSGDASGPSTNTLGLRIPIAADRRVILGKAVIDANQPLDIQAVPRQP